MSWSKTAKQTVKEKGLLDKDSDYAGGVGEALNELIDTFSKQGHSGMSAQWVANLFHNLVKYDGFLTKKDKDEAFKDWMKKQNGR